MTEGQTFYTAEFKTFFVVQCSINFGEIMLTSVDLKRVLSYPKDYEKFHFPLKKSPPLTEEINLASCAMPWNQFQSIFVKFHTIEYHAWVLFAQQIMDDYLCQHGAFGTWPQWTFYLDTYSYIFWYLNQNSTLLHCSHFFLSPINLQQKNNIITMFKSVVHTSSLCPFFVYTYIHFSSFEMMKNHRVSPSIIKHFLFHEGRHDDEEDGKKEKLMVFFCWSCPVSYRMYIHTHTHLLIWTASSHLCHYGC